MRWPTYCADDTQANGLAENVMKQIKKVWDIAMLTRHDPMAAVADFVYHKSTRVHPSTGLTPSE